MPETRRTRRTKQNQTKKTKSNKKGRIWKKIGLTLFFIIVLISITLSGLFFYNSKDFRCGSSRCYRNCIF